MFRFLLLCPPLSVCLCLSVSVWLVLPLPLSLAVSISGAVSVSACPHLFFARHGSSAIPCLSRMFFRAFAFRLRFTRLVRSALSQFSNRSSSSLPLRLHSFLFHSRFNQLLSLSLSLVLYAHLHPLSALSRCAERTRNVSLSLPLSSLPSLSSLFSFFSHFFSSLSLYLRTSPYFSFLIPSLVLFVHKPSFSFAPFFVTHTSSPRLPPLSLSPSSFPPTRPYDVSLCTYPLPYVPSGKGRKTGRKRRSLLFVRGTRRAAWEYSPVKIPPIVKYTTVPIAIFNRQKDTEEKMCKKS